MSGFLMGLTVEVLQRVVLYLMICAWPSIAGAAGRLNIQDFGSAKERVDSTGHADISFALAAAVKAANDAEKKGEPACVYIPAGLYRIVTPPPAFFRAGCLVGEGVSQSILKVDATFAGDLFVWSEAWWPTTPGPSVSGIKIVGSKGAVAIQNAFVFYDRNDQVYFDNVEVDDLHGRAIYSGGSKSVSQAYMRESHFRSLRFFGDGAPGIPVVEFSSEGAGDTDATNEIFISQMDIFGSSGPGLIIRNNGAGGVRNFEIDALRIEGWGAGNTLGDLLTIGDSQMRGNVNNIHLNNVELINPSAGFCALRLTAASGVPPSYQISFQGFIGGGEPRGSGLCLDAGRTSTFRFSGIHTFGKNVIIGPRVTEVVIDGGGQEANWSTTIDASSVAGVTHPVLQVWPRQ